MGRRVGSKNRVIDEVKNEAVLSTVSSMTVDDAASKLARVQVEVQRTLAEVGTKVNNELTTLGNIQTAINLKKEELASLRQIEATATTLDDLTAQIETQEKEWEQKRVEEEAAFVKRRQEREQLWAREEEQYNYRRTQERQKTEDEFTARLNQKGKENRDKQELLDKQWAQRELELKNREDEVLNLRKEVVSFPETLKRETDRVAAAVKREITADYETKIRIAAAESATKDKLNEQRIASLEKTITDLNINIGVLRVDLNKAHEDNKLISTKALDAASSRDTVATLQRALESAQNGKGSK